MVGDQYDVADAWIINADGVGIYIYIYNIYIYIYTSGCRVYV